MTVDIEELAAAAGDLDKTQGLLTARKTKLPNWLVSAPKGDDKLDLTKIESGVVIVFEDLDRLSQLQGWIRADSLKAKLLQHFGTIYRHYLPEKRIVIDGVLTQAVDPLFLMEHARLYDETPVRAERVETRTIEVETARSAVGKVRVRASLLPPNFQSADPSDFRPDMRGVKVNKRHEIMRDYNGIIVCRAGRQIDTISPRWTKFQNYDLNIKIEIDFDPVLDEYFSITTAKQQIVIEDEMWEKLRHDGKNGGALETLIREMRNRLEELRAELHAKVQTRDAIEAPRPSALAMQETEKFKTSAAEPTPAQQQDAERNLASAAAEQATATGRPTEVVLNELKERTSKRKWEIEFAAVPEGPFYRPYRLGEQKRLVINTEHPFHSKVYVAAPEPRYALEVMLFVLAERELDATGEAETFYKSERHKWSERLRRALNQLVTEESMQDKASAVAEIMHSAAE